MPRRDWQFRIHDILESVRAARGFCAGMSEPDFVQDQRTRRAVLHALIVIGEASGHVPDEVCRSHPGIDWARMRAMRNILVHEYFGVDASIVWRTVQDDRPRIEAQLERLLAE